MSKEVLEIVERIANERNISPQVLLSAVEAAVASASKKMIGANVMVSRVTMDPETAEFRVYAKKEVSDVVEDPSVQISVQDARAIGSTAMVGEHVELDVTPKDFGRIAAQSAKQVVLQRLREAERDMVYEKYKDRVGELIYGTVTRYERGNVVLDLGITEAVLTKDEQPMTERYRYGDKVRGIIKEIRQSTREPQVVLSRKSDQFLLKLFEQEVPEIQDKTVVIRLVAREPGKRSKIAVLSTDSNVDAVGACVGMKGSRVQMIVQELRGERIDIVEYSDDKRKLVANALKPADIENVQINEEENRAYLFVKDDQYPLAIGKGGLNARLASKLTRMEIEIIPRSRLEEQEKATKELLLKLKVLSENQVDLLMERDIFSYGDIILAGVEGLSDIEGIDEELAERVLDEVRKRIDNPDYDAEMESETEQPEVEAEQEEEEEIPENEAETEEVEEEEPQEEEPTTGAE